MLPISAENADPERPLAAIAVSIGPTTCGRRRRLPAMGRDRQRPASWTRTRRSWKTAGSEVTGGLYDLERLRRPFPGGPGDPNPPALACRANFEAPGQASGKLETGRYLLFPADKERMSNLVLAILTNSWSTGTAI